MEWADAERDGAWIRPTAGSGPREPRWGHPEGLQIGLQPGFGPRGLIRIFTPYLDHPATRLLNFVAIEPIPRGSTERGYSELEPSRIDPGAPGLRFWSTDDPADAAPREQIDPGRGLLRIAGGVERLHVHILAEPFANGAHVWVTAAFRDDQPHEVTFTTHAREDSVRLDSCILSATMGNWARLRALHLAAGEVTSAELWPDYRGSHFTDHAAFGLEELVRDGDAALFWATPDEPDPAAAEYAPGTAQHWHYLGRRGVQGWRVDDPHPRIRAQVNGRYTYWMSDAPIPGGIAFENVEMVEPFREGAEFTYFAEPMD